MKNLKLLPVGLLVAIVLVAAALPAAAVGGETWTVVSLISSGCNSSDSGWNVAYGNIDPAVQYYQETWVTDGTNVYMDEWIGPTTPWDTTWFIYNANNRGLQTALFPIPVPVQVTFRLYDAAQSPIYETTISYNCTAGTYSIVYSGPVGGQTSEPVPGCDIRIGIPSGSVVGAFVADTQAYSAPGVLTSPVVSLQAGKTAWVVGQDASGQYYKIIWACSHLWVPKATMGPNYDKVWNGTPLPTTVVK